MEVIRAPSPIFLRETRKQSAYVEDHTHHPVPPRPSNVTLKFLKNIRQSRNIILLNCIISVFSNSPEQQLHDRFKLPVYNEPSLRYSLPTETIIANSEDSASKRPVSQRKTKKRARLGNARRRILTNNIHSVNSITEYDEFDVIDASRYEHIACKEHLLQILKPIPSFDNLGSASVFLCWGKNHQCNIVPARIKDPFDLGAVWEAIREEWYHIEVVGENGCLYLMLKMCPLLR
jgi:hypothetical protein